MTLTSSSFVRAINTSARSTFSSSSNSLSVAEPFNTTAVNPKKYPEQNQFGFHPKPVGEYAYTVNNDDSYFTPENNYIRNN